ncbi:MAG TPA: phosphatase PAP2 family protein [Alphaproteobacteria bacterium]|nr:phosphatase PAP2 family protein [Alphaproteobacteria bacterium]
MRLPRTPPLSSVVVLLLLVALGVLLSISGVVDKDVAGVFYEQGQGFPAWQNHTVAALRLSTRITAYGIGCFLIFAVCWRVLLQRPLFGLSRAAVVYLMAVFLLGPGLLVNGVLKEYWGRARPSQVVEFGGDKEYTLPLHPADQCAHNCSFVSGEASLGFAFMAFGFVAVTRRRRRLGFAVGLGLGSAFGLLRIAQGGHFLSDVFFAGVFMFAFAWLLHRLFMQRWVLDRLHLSARDRRGP